MDWSQYDAALFDLDGVITPTAEVHMRAWRQMFTEFFAAESISEPYTDDDYYEYIDGRPRYEGVAALLAARNISLPEGADTDAPDVKTVKGLGNKKDAIVQEILQTEGVEPYPGSVALIDALQDRAVKMAVVSSSRNAPNVLKAAKLADRFPTIVDGKVAADHQLPGKPAPDTFVYAANVLDVPLERAVVFEDAIAGVRAGRTGNFGLVIGVDRGAGESDLRKAGANVVVQDLAEVLPS